MIEKVNKDLSCTVTTIVSISTIPYRENKYLNFIIFKDNKYHPYLLIFESDCANISIAIPYQCYDINDKIQNVKIDMHLNALLDLNGIIAFQIFDLDYKPPKKMTKKDIEKELGYKIEIVE
jgi:hypothetical protein